MQRRDFLKTGISLAAISSLPASTLAKGSEWMNTNMSDDWPIARLKDSENNSIDFNGDDINRPHDAFWNIDGYIAKKGGEPSGISEDLDVVIVGGGVAGLSTAYYLRDKKIAVLEMDFRLGGNSKGETYKNAMYSTGAAYFVEPDKDAPLAHLLNELGVWDHARRESSDHTTVLYNNKFTSPFWKGATDKAASEQFKKIFTRLAEIGAEADFDYNGELARTVDHLTFEQWLKKEFGDVHPHLLEYFQLYGWSSFCGSTDELSAYQYLGFICAETGNLMAYPGGNAYVVHKMAQAIRKAAGTRSLRAGAIVLRVTTEGDSAVVLYEDAMGNLKKIRAKKVVMACQKFVARRIIPEMPKEQFDAIGQLMYRAYLVGNIITKKPFQSPSYELYCLRGQVPPSPTALRRGDRSFTDICYGTWAQQEKVDHSVLTLYHGIPYDGARQFLFNPASHDKYKTRYLTDVEPVLKTMNLTLDDVHGIRLTRWGHSLPLAQAGLIQKGIPQRAAASINSVIHFANQDNWANPCFETAHHCALEAVHAVLKG
nr:hypothetical protein CKG001_24330 [Bdellovibrio sp. CKG001]